MWWYVETVSRLKNYVRSWIKIDSVACRTPVSTSVPSMESIVCQWGTSFLFLRMRSWWGTIMLLISTHTPGDSYRRGVRSLLLYFVSLVCACWRRLSSAVILTPFGFWPECFFARTGQLQDPTSRLVDGARLMESMCKSARKRARSWPTARTTSAQILISMNGRKLEEVTSFKLLEATLS